MTILTATPLVGSDDGNGKGDRSYIDHDYELYGGDPGSYLWWRFPGLAIPAGAVINSVTLSIEHTATSKTSGNVGSLTCQDADDAPSIRTSSPVEHPIDRTRIAQTIPNVALVNQNNNNLPEWQTVDITSIAKAILNRPGWASGNALMVFFIIDSYHPNATLALAVSGLIKRNPSDQPSILTVDYSVPGTEPPDEPEEPPSTSNTARFLPFF